MEESAITTDSGAAVYPYKKRVELELEFLLSDYFLKVGHTVLPFLIFQC